MTDTTQVKEAALRRLIWPLRLTRLGMAAERFVRSFWPVWTILLATAAAFSFGLLDLLTPRSLLGVMVALGLALIWAVILGATTFRIPTRQAALERLDQTLPGRPITALMDLPAIGKGDDQAMAVWQAHVARMAERAAAARAPEPDLRISDRDPYGLRFMAVTAFAMALLFGTIWRVADVSDAMAAAPALPGAVGPSWEGWVEPPLYTGLPSLYLNDILAEEFEAPAGSRITLRFYGDASGLVVTQSLETEISPADPTAQSRQIVLRQTGDLTISGANSRSWRILMLQDHGPQIVLAEPVEGVPPGSFQMTYSAEDDYGIARGQAVLALAPEAADRRYGLSVDPEPRGDVVLDLPLPFTGSRADFSEVVIEDFSQHPFANLPVRLTLSVEDDAGQRGESVIELDRLPGRRFFDPLANALIEMRRDLLWNRENGERVSELLRAISHEPEALFDNEEVYRSVRAVIARIESAPGGLSETLRDDLAQILWDTAILLEEGDLADALERLRRAQDRLSEAMRQGASDDEVAQLMQELREAMDDYMQELADNAEPQDGTDQPDQSGETMEMTQNDLDEMMRRIEELIQQGRMAEAQEMLDALRQMMENMQITQGGNDPNGPRSPGQEAMDGLQNTLRDQQGLADEAFRDLQEGFNPNGGRPDGTEPEGNQQGNAEGGDSQEGSLAERQRELFEQLREQAEGLPGRGSPDGDEALQRLEEAGRAMRDAIEELEGGELADALDSQSEAMEALREGMEALGEALAADDGDEPGQGQADGNMRADRPTEDPLGRQSGNGGALGSEEAFEQREEAFRRARDLLDEIRRRSAEQDRSEIELDYLRRLLDRFGQTTE